MSRRTWWLLGVVALGFPVPAVAQPKGGAPQQVSAPAEPLTEDQQKAQVHFQRAKDLYAAGSYREAIGELDAARALDPKAKDLVFNLGIVHEKLGRYDEAITFFHQYMEMDNVTSAEKQKAESIIKRIEGAKREVPVPTPQASASTSASARPAHPDPPDKPARGRIDGLTIGAGAVAVVGLGVGIGFGIRAISLRPSNFVTGRDGSVDDLKSKNDDAHTSAIIADVGFAVGIVSAIAAAYLYFGRPRDPHYTIAPSAVPTPGGGMVGLGGYFR